MKQLWQKEKADLFNIFQSSPNGLTTEEAHTRLGQYGKNKLQEAKQKGLLQVFLSQFADLLVGILIVAAVISAITGGVEGAIVIIAVLLLNAVLGTVQHFKAQKSLDSLKTMSAPLACVMRDGMKMEIPAAQLVPGDILLLEAGDIAAADGRIVENFSLQVNESALTGEAEAVQKISDRINHTELALGDRRNMVYSGSLITYGRAEVLITATGMQTELGKIAHLLESAREKITPLQRSLNLFSQKLSIAVLVVCILILGLSMLRGMALTDALMFAVALAVAAIPEALGSIVTIGLAIGTQRMAQEHAIIKELRAVESLGCVSVICSDKTGTLTQNKMTVQHIHVVGEEQDKLSSEKKEELFARLVECSVLCNDGVYHNDATLGDPTETALLDFCHKLGWSAQKIRDLYPRLQELPFDSERKRMSTLHQRETGIIQYTKGAPDVLLHCCKYIVTGSGTTLLTEALRQKIEEQIAAFSMQGLRVLAFAEKEAAAIQLLTPESESDMTFLGLMAMMDPPRPESAKAVADCYTAGIRPVMITGDHKATAQAIATQIGIWREGDRIVEGAELEKMSDEQLQSEVERITVYARVSPEHKIRIVRAWQANGCVTAMTGDGVNDAPALKQADIGIAMGVTGTNVSKDASAMILTDDNFATIVKAVENGRNVYTNIRNAIHFLLSGNLAAIIVVIYTSLLGLPLPFTAVQLLFINLVTDSLPALALNMETPSQNLLLQNPRNQNESILTKPLLKQLVMQSVLLSISTLAAFYLGLAISENMACTLAFAVLCLARLFHGFNCRGEIALIHMPPNFYSIGALVLGAALLFAVLYLPVLQPLFDIDAALLPVNALLILGLAALPTILIQLYRTTKKYTPHID